MKSKKLLIYLTGIVILAVIILLIVYKNLFGLNVKTDGSDRVLFIPTGSTYEQVIDTLESNLDIKNSNHLKWIAEKKKYPLFIKPGKYIITKDMSYPGLINLLRSGKQAPVRITFNKIRTLNQLAGKIGKQIEADSSMIICFFENDSNYVSDGFSRADIISVFIPNTYQLFWNTDARCLYDRMFKEYKLFWNDKRREKAKEKGLDQKEVAILASIIDDEVAKPDEKPRIAGVYLNRLKRRIPLQACPTIKFAMNDFTITRILDKYLKVESPYNTYTHRGFPPGPIGCPSIEGIDAVLNAEKHDYFYFAAKADFSGYHNFSKTLAEHNHYAALYQRELNKRKIFR